MQRAGRANPLVTLILVSTIVLLAVLFLLFHEQGTPTADVEVERDGLFMFCAAGMRPAIERIAIEYKNEYGVPVRLQYGGSNTLLSQLEVGKVGDLYLAADDSYTELARQKGLVQEVIPVATMRLVIAVAAGNPKAILGINDLLRTDVRVVLGNPDQTAIGKLTRRVLEESGHWSALEKHVTQNGVFKPTVNDAANDVKLGSVDASIVWDATARQYPEIEAIRVPELDKGTGHITVGVITNSKTPTAALRFARYIASPDRGLNEFQALGYEPVDGDQWAEVPELTFFVGAVNRKALGPIIEAFGRREGVIINTVYNGCGILTATMRSMREKDQTSGFPDMYLACDVYYLDTVRDLFQDAANVSDTDIVIVVQKGNPKNVTGLADLARPGMRIALGQPDQCTIGVLSKRLLDDAGISAEVMPNVVTQTATSALLVPNITTGSADAVLAYATDTLAERDRLDVIPIASPLAKAIQPYSIARSSHFKHIARRLLQAIAQSRDQWESAGFHWQIGEGSESSVPTGEN